MKNITLTKDKNLEDHVNLVLAVLNVLNEEHGSFFDFEGILNSLKSMPPEINRQSVVRTNDSNWRAQQFIDIVQGEQQWIIILYKQYLDNTVEEFKFYSLTGIDFIVKWNAPNKTPILDRTIKDKNGKILQKDAISFLNQTSKYLVSEQEINGVVQPSQHKEISAAYIMMLASQKFNKFKHEQYTHGL